MSSPNIALEAGDKGKDTIEVEVAYALPKRQEIIALRVRKGTSALEAARQSGIAEMFPEINLHEAPMGIFSRLLDGRTLPLPERYALEENDRVEIYRPLPASPMEIRRRRAGKG